MLIALASDIRGNLPPRGRIVRFDYDRDRTPAAFEKTSLQKKLRKDFAEGSEMRYLP